MNIRSLQLSREIVIFLVVTGLMSVVYIYLNVGDHLAPPTRFNTPELDVGKTVDVVITLVTADSTSLGCASDETSGAAHCAYALDGTPWDRKHPDDAGKATAGDTTDVIAPYMTTDQVLLLVAGLWQEPALVKRLQDEPPSKYERDQLKRFIASCKMTIDKRLPGNAFKVRWAATGPFGEPPGEARTKGASVGRVTACSITDTNN